MPAVYPPHSPHRQDGGDQCCICRQDLLECAQDPSVASDACRAAQAQGLGWQAVRDAYLDYQLDEKTDCFQVFPSWTGNEPRKEDVDWAYVDPDSPDSETRPCAYTAFFSASTRSVFSQLKPPSASGARPKCP